MVTNSFDTGILQRIIGSGADDLPPEVASFFLGLSFTEADEERIAELSEKSNEGQLTGEERDQLGMYVLLSDFLAIMQPRARGSLESRSRGENSTARAANP